MIVAILYAVAFALLMLFLIWKIAWAQYVALAVILFTVTLHWRALFHPTLDA